MRRLSNGRRVLLLLIGAAVLAVVFVNYDAKSVIEAFLKVRFGLLIFVAYHFLPLVLHTLGWGVLFDPGKRPNPGRFVWARTIGEAMNNLVPAGQVGGDVVRAHLVAGPPAGTTRAIASVVVDVTRGLLAQVAVGIVGLLLLVERVEIDGHAYVLLSAALLLSLLVGALAISQRFGLFGAATRIAAGLASRFDLDRHRTWASELDREIAELYRGWSRRVLCYAFRLGGRLSNTGEAWLGLWLLGQQAGPLDALILYSVSSLVRSAAFMIPGGLGVQEGSMALVGGMLGIPPESALALGLMIRARELLFGLPALISWFVYERRRSE